MGKPGQVESADWSGWEGGQRWADRERDAFAQLTGVSRERLRTWERRHGFPAPQRDRRGPRRYRLRDVARVVAVRRASEDGVPMRGRSRAPTTTSRPPQMAAQAFAALVEHAPLPVAALSGPEPLAWRTSTARCAR